MDIILKFVIDRWCYCEVVVNEKYLGYSVRDTKIDLSETPTDKLKHDLKKVQYNINDLEKELYATKGSAPVYGIKEQISNLELLKSRIEKELEERNDEKMENTMFDSMAELLQEFVNDGSLDVDYANELLEFAVNDYNDEEYSSNVDRLEDVVESVVDKLGIVDLTVFDEMDRDEILDVLKDETVRQYQEGVLAEEHAALILEYLDLDNYDENLIFIESIESDAEDSLGDNAGKTDAENALVGVSNGDRITIKKQYNDITDGGKKINAETRGESPDQFKEKIIGDTPRRSIQKLVEGNTSIPSDWKESADDNFWRNAGEQIKDGLDTMSAKGTVMRRRISKKIDNAKKEHEAAKRRKIRKEKFNSTKVGQALGKAEDKLVDTTTDVASKLPTKRDIKKAKFNAEVNAEKTRRKIKKTTSNIADNINEQIKKIEAEISRLKEKLSKTDDDGEKAKITAKIAALFEKLKIKKDELKAARAKNKDEFDD